jgi:hypothetical protein
VNGFLLSGSDRQLTYGFTVASDAPAVVSFAVQGNSWYDHSLFFSVTDAAGSSLTPSWSTGFSTWIPDQPRTWTAGYHLAAGDYQAHLQLSTMAPDVRVGISDLQVAIVPEPGASHLLIAALLAFAIGRLSRRFLP